MNLNHTNLPVSFKSRLYEAVFPLVFILIILGIFFLFEEFVFDKQIGLKAHDFFTEDIFSALSMTFLRLLIAYFLAVFFAFFIILVVNINNYTQRFLAPIFDVFKSIPILVFLPIIALFFYQFNFLNGATIFILFLTMLWILVFHLGEGLKAIPKEIKQVGQIFDIRGIQYLKSIVLPSIIPSFVVGSMIAWSQAWNIVIVAEVLHTYLPDASPSNNPWGIGDILVSSLASSGQNIMFIYAVIAMTLLIALMNFFIWHKLLNYAKRFRFK